MQCCLLFHAQIRLWSLQLKIFGFFIACQSLYYTTEHFIVPIIWLPPTFSVCFLSTPSLCHSRNHFLKFFKLKSFFQFRSVQSLRRVWLFATYESQHARPPCPSLTPRVFFRFMETLRGRFWNFLYSPSPNTCPASSTINGPNQSDTFGTIDESTLTHHNHPKSIVYMRVYSWFCTCCRLTHMYMYNDR